MRDGVRTKVNCNIDSNLKMLFEATQETHKKTWSEVLETAVKELLVETDPIQVLEYLIKIEAEKQEKRRLALSSARENIQALVTTSSKVDADLEKKREEIFQKDSGFLPKQIIQGDANWSRIFFHYQFENKKEALAWFRPRIERLEELKKKR